MAAVSDDGSICGLLIEELRFKFPNYDWRTKLHSNVIRGFADNYNIMIVYFRGTKNFEVSIRGLQIQALINDKDAIIALGKLKTEMYEKKTQIEKVIEDLNEEKLEDKRNG